jgi:hypothetical protein
MTSGTQRPQGASDPLSSSGFTLDTININGENVGVIQLAKFDMMEHIENLRVRRLASEEKTYHRILTPGKTPVNSLPSELLSYIFTLGSEAEEDGDHDDDDDDDDKEDDETSVFLPPRPRSRGPRLPFKVLVSHVCQRWRTVAIETSTLWTHLNFIEGPPFDKSRTWLERSKGCALDIELDCTVGEDAPDSDESDDLPPDAFLNDDNNANDDSRVAMPGGPAPVKSKTPKPYDRIAPADLPVVRNLILPHASRWRIFELTVNDYQIMHGILSTLSSVPEAPQLEVLRLYHYDDNEDYDHFRPPQLKQPLFVPFRGRAPNLLQVTLWGVHVDWEACAFLQGLDDLELAYHAKDVRPPYQVFARILQRSPDLHILTLSASGPAGNPEDWPTDVIELPSVKHLVLAFVEPSYASALMKRLVFPGLLTLALDFDSTDYSSFLVQLSRPAPNQRHSVCHNLVDLKISGMQCTAAALATFYAALPNLTSLNLNCHHLPRLFFRHLYPCDADKLDGFFLPKLETLSTSGITGTEMRDLLMNRAALPIKHVLMESETDIDYGEEKWIRDNVETFEYFDGSDDEDDEDDPIITELDEQEMGTVALSAEGDGVPGEWVDEDEPIA